MRAQRRWRGLAPWGIVVPGCNKYQRRLQTAALVPNVERNRRSPVLVCRRGSSRCINSLPSCSKTWGGSVRFMVNDYSDDELSALVQSQHAIIVGAITGTQTSVNDFLVRFMKRASLFACCVTLRVWIPYSISIEYDCRYFVHIHTCAPVFIPGTVCM